MRAVLDTNILISGFLFGGMPRTIVETCLGGGFTLVTSGVLLDELEEKLQGKFAVPLVMRSVFIGRLKSRGCVVEPDFELDVVAEDPDDNRVIECAVGGKADCIVSGDKHLLRLSSYEGIAILTARQFLEAGGLRIG